MSLSAFSNTAPLDTMGFADIVIIKTNYEN